MCVTTSPRATDVESHTTAPAAPLTVEEDAKPSASVSTLTEFVVEQMATRTPEMSLINWDEFWSAKTIPQEWLIEPIVAAGRQTAIYSAAKTGKSLLALDVSAAAATGGSVLGREPKEPLDVLYLDWEMTQDDVRERLNHLGYTPDDDLSRLHYSLLPSIPALDTEFGGEVLLEEALRAKAQVVVIDTVCRAVAGGESDADTFRAFYRYTGQRLKAAGIALLRLDHQGKDKTQGQRGSSAKVDDPDIVFRLSKSDSHTLKLSCTHSRVPWAPTEVMLLREDEPHLRHRQQDGVLPHAVQECMRLLTELEVSVDATLKDTVAALRAAGRGTRRETVVAAQKARREAE